MKESKIYQLKIVLDGARPPIWRRIQVPGDVSLFKLHFILQIAMGWTNSHLHEFIIGDQPYGNPEDDEYGDRGTRDEKDFLLELVIPRAGFRFSYLYDFGDGWQHTVLVEGIRDREEDQRYPAGLDGERACPPEDVGGIWGYTDFLAAIRDPEHPEHKEYLAWAGGEFDPEAFDRDGVDTALKDMDRSEMVRVYNRYYSGEVGPELKPYWAVSDWLQVLTAEEHSQIERLPLRRDCLTLLEYLHGHRITGTQSSGNLPLKAIREVTAKFVHPPVLDEKIGDRIYKLRSEYDVWPVYFRHALLETGGLLEGGPARKFHLTPKGEQFLASEPAVQLWFMLETWWYHTNWLFAVPWGGIGERLSPDFELTTLGHLLELEAGIPIPHERFADRLIQAIQLKWTAPDMTHARDLLHSSIEQMVIDILEDFGAVEREDQDEWIGSYKTKRLYTFSLTRFGKGLLKTIASG